MSVIKDLSKLKNTKKALLLSRFFKTGPGQYGEGDTFWGIMVPQQREVAKRHKDASPQEIQDLLVSPVHECRLTGLFILIGQYSSANSAGKQIYKDFYISNIHRVNNWDLVDLSAHKILGDWLLSHPEEKHILYKLAKSTNLWHRRIAVISTFAFLKSKDFADSFSLAEMLLDDDHDLIHKAVGWMLREIGKIDQMAEEGFLRKYAKTMPRTMLRYAIEKFSEDKRRFYMR